MSRLLSKRRMQEIEDHRRRSREWEIGMWCELAAFFLLPIVVLAAVVLFGGDAFGQDAQAAPSPGQVFASPDLAEGRARGVVRVKNIACRMTLRGQECGESLGSGTVIGTTTDNTHLIVLSCAHVFQVRGRPQVEVGPRVWRDATMRAIDYRSDLSLLIVPSAEPIPGIAVAQAPPTTADPLVTRGYPDASMFIERPTHVIGSKNHLWDVDCRPIGGESGGCLLSPAGVVGVVVLAELEDPEKPERNPGGRVVGWPTLAKFVNATFPIQRAAEDQRFRRNDPNDRGPNPLAPAPLPAAPAVVDRPQPPATVAKPPEAPAEKAAPPAEIDWSLVQVVVCWPRQKALDPWDWLVRGGEYLATKEDGVGDTIRQIINASSGGKADVRFVFERLQPARYAAVLDASGLTPGKYLGLVVMAKQQDSSLLDPIRNIAVRWGERALAEKLGDMPFEVILERTSPNVFSATQAALDFKEPEGSSPGNWLTALLGPLAGWASEWFRQRKEGASLWTLS